MQHQDGSDIEDSARTRGSRAGPVLSAEQIARVGDIELTYQTMGDPASPTVLLVMGLGMQLVHWNPDLCRMIAGRGLHVVRFDNRDTGTSTKTQGAPPNLLAALLRRPGAATYAIDDMADDAAGLLDHLGGDAAHVVGASMGGMIAQALAIRHPERVLTLSSIMSHPGERGGGRPRTRALSALLRPGAHDREAYVEQVVRTFRVIGSPGFPLAEEELRRAAAAAYDRSYHPVGVARQLAAILTATDRTPGLRRLRVPTLVLHGQADPLIPVAGGVATARAVPGARLVVVPGMAHDLPRAVWPRLVDELERLTARASVPTRASARAAA